MDHLLEATQVYRDRGGTLLFSLLPETTNTLNSLVMELQQEVCCGAGYFCRKGLKEPTHTWSWPSERGGIAGKTPLMGED